jgi:phosphohistidine phosphatase SixA
MRLIIVRHGKAVDREKWHQDDTERPLTKDGVEQATRMFKLVRDWVQADEVWTSPWTRARQTAELAAGVWKLPLREVDWLAGEAMPAQNRVRQLPRGIDVALVGHEPDLGAFIGSLIGGNPVPLKKAGIAVLEGEAALGAMQLRLLLTPKMVLGLAER